MGKGSSRRVEDPKKFDRGWAQIDWGKKPEPCPKCGGATEQFSQPGRSGPANRCLANGCTWDE